MKIPSTYLVERQGKINKKVVFGMKKMLENCKFKSIADKKAQKVK